MLGIIKFTGIAHRSPKRPQACLNDCWDTVLRLPFAHLAGLPVLFSAFIIDHGFVFAVTSARSFLLLKEPHFQSLYIPFLYL